MTTKNPIVAVIASSAKPYTNIVKEANLDLHYRQEARFATQHCMNNSMLRTAEPESIRDAFLELASIGLTLNPALQQCTIVPRRVNVGNRQQPNWVVRAFAQPMYRGLLTLATDDDMVTACEVDVVYEEDHFIYKKGLKPVLEHTPKFKGDRGEFFGCYVLAHLPNLDRPLVEWVEKEDIYGARDRSEAYRDDQGKLRDTAPWVRDFDEMAKKTALKQAQKRWPRKGARATRFDKAIQMDHKAEGTRNIIDGEATEVVVISEDQHKELLAAMRKAKLKAELFCQAFGIDRVKDLPAARFDEALERCKARESKSTAITAAKQSQKNGSTSETANETTPEPSPSNDVSISDEDMQEFLDQMDEEQKRQDENDDAGQTES